jgi:twitching motility protein PilT
MSPATLSIDTLLEQMVTQNASDLHVTVGAPPAIRVRGHIQPLASAAPLSADDLQQLIYRILSSEQQKHLEIKRQLDLSYSIPGLARFRVNVYHQRGTIGAAFRLIPHELKTLEELGLPPSLHQLTEKPRGLVLVTGPTGSGKSTTLAAMIDEINRTRRQHILTIEDPIEFLHRHKGCIVNQREIGPDAVSFAEALRGALRQDPDVILLGEMRDLETIGTALTAAETGHLVFGTVHTQSAPSTIDRLIDVFPAAQQEQIRIQIAATLQGVVTQTLLPTADGRGRAPSIEILLPDDAVRNLIRQAKVEQIYSVMQTSTGRGMQTMEQSLLELVLRGMITTEIALGASSRPDQLNGLLARAGVAVSEQTQAPIEPAPTGPPPPQPPAALRVAGS